jgi:hypothetical protein
VDPESRFREVFEVAYVPLWRYARHRGLDGPDAKDLVTQVLEVAWRRVEEVPAKEPLPWLYAVADNLYRGQMHRTRRRHGLLRRFMAPLPVEAVDRTDCDCQFSPASPEASALLGSVLARSLSAENPRQTRPTRRILFIGIPAAVAAMGGIAAAAARNRSGPPGTIPACAGSVTGYGADPSGVTDSTAAIQAAINDLQNGSGAGSVYFQSGTYKITGSITIPASLNGLAIVGSSVQSAYIVQHSLSSPIFVASPISGTSIINLTIKDLTLQYSSTAGSTAYAISFTPAPGGAVEEVIIDDVNINFAAGGLNANGKVQVVTISNCMWANFTDDGSGKSALYLVNGASGFNCQASVFTGRSSSGTLQGLTCDTNSGTLRCVATAVSVFKYGIHFLNSLGGIAPGGLYGIDLECENNGTGIQLDAGQDIYLSSCFIGGSQSGPGIAAGASFNGWMTINGGTISNNHNEGISIAGGQQYGISGARIYLNSQAGSGTSPGVQIFNDALSVAIGTCIITGSTQTYGVQIQNTANQIAIVGNMLSGNGAGTTSNTSNGGDIVVASNA